MHFNKFTHLYELTEQEMAAINKELNDQDEAVINLRTTLNDRNELAENLIKDKQMLRDQISELSGQLTFYKKQHTIANELLSDMYKRTNAKPRYFNRITELWA